MSRAVVQAQLSKTENDDLFEIAAMNTEVRFEVVPKDGDFVIEVSTMKEGIEKIKSWYFAHGTFPVIDEYLHANRAFQAAYIKYVSEEYKKLAEVRKKLVGDNRAPFEPI